VKRLIDAVAQEERLPLIAHGHDEWQEYDPWHRPAHMPQFHSWCEVHDWGVLIAGDGTAYTTCLTAVAPQHPAKRRRKRKP